MDGLVLKRPLLPKDLRTDRRILRFLRESAPREQGRRHCALAVLTVGEEGRTSRPRPVEIAVAFDDGTAISTLVNPLRDLADARTAYGISTTDVLVAPTLAEAWALLAPTLAGCVPVGVDIDTTLGLIDAELKRLGEVVPLPFGSAVATDAVPPAHRAALGSGRALERARATLAGHRETAAGASAFADAEATTAPGHLLTRDDDAAPPVLPHLPGLSAILQVSRQVAGVVLGHEDGARQVHGGDSGQAAARQAVADQLRAAVARVQVPPALLERLRVVGTVLGHEVVEHDAASPGPDGWEIEEVLTPGARICFTGELITPEGRTLSRDEVHDLAAGRGLRPVANVTRTRCEVLVVAEVGTQSGKARRAREYGKPVLSAEEFLAWVGRGAQRAVAGG